MQTLLKIVREACGRVLQCTLLEWKWSGKLYSKVCLLRLCICNFSMLYPFPLSPPTSWSELQVWPQGALVKHVRGLFKAEGINVTAEPGNSLHARFYVSQSFMLPSFSRSFLSFSLSASSSVSVCSVYLCLSVYLSLSLSVCLSFSSHSVPFHHPISFPPSPSIFSLSLFSPINALCFHSLSSSASFISTISCYYFPFQSRT